MISTRSVCSLPKHSQHHQEFIFVTKYTHFIDLVKFVAFTNIPNVHHYEFITRYKYGKNQSSWTIMRRKYRYT
jgi:hypothetical protein